MTDFDRWLDRFDEEHALCRALHLPWWFPRGDYVFDHKCLENRGHEGRHECGACGRHWRDPTRRSVITDTATLVAVQLLILGYLLGQSWLSGWTWPDVVVMPLIGFGIGMNVRVGRRRLSRLSLRRVEAPRGLARALRLFGFHLELVEQVGGEIL